MKPINIKNASPLKSLLPLVQKTRRASRKYYERTALRLVIDGGDVAFMDSVLSFPENAGFDYATPLYWDGAYSYEPETSHVIASLIAKSALFFDVGSHLGIYSVYAGVKHPEVITYAFEPVPEIWEKNLAFHKANGLPVERVLNLALSDDCEPKKIFIPVYEGSNLVQQTGTLRDDSWQADHEKVDSFEIKCTTLDLLTSAGSLPEGNCLLKIDVENYEPAVLKGGRAFILKRRPWIVCEILPCEEYNRETKTKNNNNRESTKLIAELGYIPFAITSAGIFRMTFPDFARPRELKDFLLLPIENISSDVSYLPLKTFTNEISP